MDCLRLMNCLVQHPTNIRLERQRKQREALKKQREEEQKKAAVSLQHSLNTTEEREEKNGEDEDEEEKEQEEDNDAEEDELIRQLIQKQMQAQENLQAEIHKRLTDKDGSGLSTVSAPYLKSSSSSSSNSTSTQQLGGLPASSLPQTAVSTPIANTMALAPDSAVLANRHKGTGIPLGISFSM